MTPDSNRPYRSATALPAALAIAALLTLLGACASPGPAAPEAVAAALPPVSIVQAVPVPAAAAAPSPEVAASAAQAAAPESIPVPAAVAPVDPLRPDVPVDLNDSMAQIDLWQRVRNGFGIADLDDGYVRKREYYYARQPEYVQRMADRGTRYLFHIVEEVQKRNLPTELALLPFIESAFNPQAMSSARAAGRPPGGISI
jgi:membrane-bound lytic murein transglycosylase D